MKYLLLLPFLLLMTSCVDEEDAVTLPDNELSGSWRLVEQYRSPAGVGYNQPVESDLVITFNNNGSFEANFSVCGVTANNPELSTGFYSLEERTLTPRSCSAFLGDTVPYYLSEDGDLTINIFWGCVEGCWGTYRRE